ncbi:MAG: SH3 domain-containing protein [Thermomicrobiales bacterium]
MDELTTVTNLVSRHVNRRSLLKSSLGAAAAVFAGNRMINPGSAAAALDDSSHYRTTTALNLRKTASSSAQVLLVMPAGSIVEDLDDSQNGYRNVAYQGTSGWAYEDFLEVSNGGSTTPPVVIGTATLITAANFRTGASNGHSVIAVLAAGDIVEYTDKTLYGYRGVYSDDQYGWIYEDYLSLDSGSDAVPYYTQIPANFRTEPNVNGKVITVLPAGVQVLDYDGVFENGYRGVDYYGTVGWIYDDYLDVNPPQEPEEGPITFKTTTSVNLRKSSNSSSQVLKVVPADAEVIDYDLVMENGYRGVDYNGTVGWIYDTYLTR